MKTGILLFTAVLFSIGTGCKNNETSTSPKNTESHAAHTVTTSANNYCDSINNGLIQDDTLKGSPHRTSMATINGTHTHIEYSSPGVKDRIIWGGLVAYDKVWVSGAHNATTVQFSKDVVINNKKIKAGIYALFTIPGKEKWIAIFNSRFDQHLADDYNEKEDVVRMSITPQPCQLTPRLSYTIVQKDSLAGEIQLQWEKIQIAIPFKTTTE